jgi:hypothetical protein
MVTLFFLFADIWAGTNSQVQFPIVSRKSLTVDSCRSGLVIICMLIKQSFSFGSSLTSFLACEVNIVWIFHKLKLNVKEQRGVRK